MRSASYLLALASLSCVIASALHAAQAVAAATADTSDGANETAAGRDADSIEGLPKRLAGALARPEAGVQHPDLDSAWGKYNEAVAKATAKIQSVIENQVNVAIAKGDTNAVVQWRKSADVFNGDGSVSNEAAKLAGVATAGKDHERAKGELSDAYESVAKSLTMQDNIPQALAVEEEWRTINNLRAAAIQIPADTEQLRLRKEFEQVGDRGGWLWLQVAQPAAGGPVYKLNKTTKEFTHFYSDPNGRPVRLAELSPIYEILGVDATDPNVTLIKMTFPPKQPGGEAPTAVYRFERASGEIHSPFGYFGKPKNPR